MEIQMEVDIRKAYISDAVEKMLKLQREIDILEKQKDILLEFVRENDLKEIKQLFDDLLCAKEVS